MPNFASVRVMKKLLITSAVLATITMPANAEFVTRSEQLDQRREIIAEEKAREKVVESSVVQTYEEMKKANALNSEIAGKLDVLIENSAKQNELMEELLRRTE